MKSKIKIICLASLLLCAFALNLPAQTPSPLTTPLTDMLAQTANTNITQFATEQFQLRIGTENLGIGQNGFGVTLGASWHVSSTLSLETKFVNANIGGTLLDALIGAGVSKSYANFQFTGAMLCGQNFETGTFEGEGLMRVSYIPSAATSHVGIYTEIGLKIDGTNNQQRPGSFVGAGVTYSF